MGCEERTVAEMGSKWKPRQTAQGDKPKGRFGSMRGKEPSPLKRIYFPQDRRRLLDRLRAKDCQAQQQLEDEQ